MTVKELKEELANYHGFTVSSLKGMLKLALVEELVTKEWVKKINQI